MKDYIKKMRECSNRLSDIMLDFKQALMEMVKANGGFIDLSDAIVNPNSDKDKVYGLALDESEELREYYMYALRLIEDGEHLYLECFLVPKMRTFIEVFTKEDMFSEEYNDYWYSLDGLDDMLYQWETLVGMIDYIDEFDQFGTICVYTIIEHLTNKK